MDPFVCPSCGRVDVDTPDVAEAINTQEFGETLVQWVVCNNPECRVQWNARYAFVENFDIRKEG